MSRYWRERRLAFMACLAFTLAALAPLSGGPAAQDPEVTLRGSVICNGACLPDPKKADHACLPRDLAPTSAEWEYAARVGTSDPGFAEKYKDQNSSGPDGFKAPLKVRSKKGNAWGLYDMASCWWEITGDRAMYHVRRSVVDPHYPPGVENARSQRSGRGIVNARWSIGTHEFITERADYAGQKFRVVVEIDGKDANP